MLDIPMATRMILSGISAALFPLVLVILDHFIHCGHKSFMLLVFFVYVLIVIRVTLLGRETGATGNVNISPFWSYQMFSHSDLRWQVYMNIFLFIPFGFMLGYFFHFNFFQSVIIGCSFSIAIESIQLLFRIGLCEFDDVFHNTVGTILGFFYYKIINLQRNK